MVQNQFKVVTIISIKTDFHKSKYMMQELAQYWKQTTAHHIIVFTCNDLIKKELDMSVWDAAGNTDYCTVS